MKIRRYQNREIWINQGMGVVIIELDDVPVNTKHDPFLLKKDHTQRIK